MFRKIVLRVATIAFGLLKIRVVFREVAELLSYLAVQFGYLALSLRAVEKRLCNGLQSRGDGSIPVLAFRCLKTYSLE
jgi:hypothetical protein